MPSYAYLKTRRARIRQELRDMLGGKCENCGSPDKLHFVYKDPITKKFLISQQLNRGRASLEAEARKCYLLCNKCHSRKIVQDNGWDGSHGRLSRYTNNNCRCGLCREAMRLYMQEKRHDQQRQHSTRRIASPAIL